MVSYKPLRKCLHFVQELKEILQKDKLKQYINIWYLNACQVDISML